MRINRSTRSAPLSHIAKAARTKTDSSVQEGHKLRGTTSARPRNIACSIAQTDSQSLQDSRARISRLEKLLNDASSEAPPTIATKRPESAQISWRTRR